MSDVTHAYVGIAPCGCVRMATVDKPDATKEEKRDNAKEIASCIRRGYRIERWELARVRTASAWNCGSDLCPFRKESAK